MKKCIQIYSPEHPAFGVIEFARFVAVGSRRNACQDQVVSSIILCTVPVDHTAAASGCGECDRDTLHVVCGIASGVCAGQVGDRGNCRIAVMADKTVTIIEAEIEKKKFIGDALTNPNIIKKIMIYSH